MAHKLKLFILSKLSLNVQLFIVIQFRKKHEQRCSVCLNS